MYPWQLHNFYTLLDYTEEGASSDSLSLFIISTIPWLTFCSSTHQKCWKINFHSAQFWMPLLWASPPIWSFALFFFFKPQLWRHFFWLYHPSEIWHKHKNILMWESYFLIFTRLKNNITWFFISNSFIRNTRPGFDE